MGTLDITACDSSANLIFLGTEAGELMACDGASLRSLWRRHAHAGAVQAVAAHPHHPLLATLGRDRRIVLWSVNARGGHPISHLNLRNSEPWDHRATPFSYPAAPSSALCFHPRLERLAVGAARSGVLELGFRHDKLLALHCVRLHGDATVTALAYSGDDAASLFSVAAQCVQLSCNGVRVRHWDLPGQTPRWIEVLSEGHCLLASAARKVLRLDAGASGVVEGPILTRDEVVHLCADLSGRCILAAAADGTVHEIDPDTCAAVRFCVRLPSAPWRIMAPESSATRIAHCRDGGLYRIDAAPRSIRPVLRETPPAVFCALCLDDGRLLFAGEGRRVVTMHRCERRLDPGLELDTATDPCQVRCLSDGADGEVWLGLTSGELMCARENTVRRVGAFAAPILDLAYSQAARRVFVCLEDGAVHALAADSADMVSSWLSPRGEPLRALACHPHARIVAVAERTGNVFFLDQMALGPVRSVPAPGRIRRMRWLDDDVLLLACDDCVLRYRWSEHRLESGLAPCGAAIVDFGWNREFGYLVAINAERELLLCDLDDGTLLYRAADRGEPSCGVLVLGGTAGALEVLTFGHSGDIHAYRLHNESLLAVEPFARGILSAP